MAKAKNSNKFFKKLFLVAAIYDFFLGLFFLLFYEPVYALFSVPLPTYPVYLQMTAAFVTAMGVGYYFVYKNMYQNIDIVKLGIVYKAIYVGFTSYWYFVGLAHVLFFRFAIIDAIFLVLFVWFLVYTKKRKK